MRKHADRRENSDWVLSRAFGLEPPFSRRGIGDRKGHGYEYHLLAIALAAVIVVRGSGAASLDRLFFN